MMKRDKIENYQSFFADQVKETIDEQQKINKSKIYQLFKSDELSLAYVDSVQKEIGIVILKCPLKMAPRLKVQKSIVVIRKCAFQELGVQPTKWDCSWESFCVNPNYHSSESEIIPMYYVRGSNPGYDYIACTGISLRLYNLFVNSISEGKSLSVLIYNPFPPVEYYKNLNTYMDAFSFNEDLYIEPNISYEDWNPEELAYDENNESGISETIMKALDDDKCCIVQGPPGSGKSYTIANIISKYLDEQKTVCVTTMANKGLIELIKQEPLKKYILEGKICKTNLSVDEQKQIGKVKESPIGLQVNNGELLCATNYVLSSVYSDKNMELYGIPHYDLIVVEEASQVFLTSIVAFKQLGDRCLIVGDPMQLPPIVKLNNPTYKQWNVYTQIDGLTTFALGSKIKSYRIVTSFRLTQKSASLTRLFYGNRFVSVKKEYLDFSLIKSDLFPTEGGVLYCCTNDVKNGYYSEKADKLINFVVERIKQFYPERRLAIITPFRDTVKELQKRFVVSNSELEIMVETVDRIQGMTVDYAILYLPGRYPEFSLENRRFNVATSRSLSTTLVISDVQLKNYNTVSSNVLQFIENCDIVKDNYDVEVQPISKHSFISSDEKKSTNIGVKVIGKIDLSKYERSKKEIKIEKRNYYLIDTNIFIYCPEIINYIDIKYPIILSAKVTDELDKMKIKLDDRGKRNAEKALYALNHEKSHKVLYEFADVSLLPDDFDRHSPDNMILSVALKYKHENPIVLTSDNGLQLKSKLFGISTISLSQFLKR